MDEEQFFKERGDSNIFNQAAHTIIINRKRSEFNKTFEFYKIDDHQTVVEAVMECLYNKQLNSVIIEGGSKTIQFFINAGLWDEARVITNTALYLKKGVNAPLLYDRRLKTSFNILTDRIDFFQKNNNDSL